MERRRRECPVGGGRGGGLGSGGILPHNILKS